MISYRTKINWAFIAAIIVSVLWLIGDISIVGFQPDPKDYPLFSQKYADKVDVSIAIHMLTGSTRRLMFGALVGALSAPLLIPTMWLVYQFFIDKQKLLSLVTFYILIIGAVLSPLAHASFFYVGEIYKTIHTTNDVTQQLKLLAVAQGFEKMLFISWTTAISFLAIGWGMLFVSILMKKALLPKWFAFLTPLMITMYVMPITIVLPKPFSGWVGGAAFNISYLAFFIVLFIYFKRKLKIVDESTIIATKELTL